MASFDKRVKQIADAEKDVDKVLKAARLKRIENGETTGQIFYKTILTLCITAVCIAGIIGYGVPFVLIGVLFALFFITIIALLKGDI